MSSKDTEAIRAAARDAVITNFGVLIGLLTVTYTGPVSNFDTTAGRWFLVAQVAGLLLAFAAVFVPVWVRVAGRRRKAQVTR